MEKWMVAAKKADFRKLGEKFQLDPVTIRLIRNRNIWVRMPYGNICMEI